MSTRPPRGRQKPRKETSPAAPLKVVVRRLPPNLPENIFHTSVSAWHKLIDWSEFIPGRLATSRLDRDKFSRAYLKFRKQSDCADFIKRYHGHLFINAEGKEYKACAQYAPFQRIAKPLSNAVKAKDTLSGTIEQDPDYIEFVESLKNVLPHQKEAEVVPTKITPLIEHLRAQKAKNEEKAKARKAREAASKGKQQEEKRKAAQAKADADTAKMKEKAASAKNNKNKTTKSHTKDAAKPANVKDEAQALEGNRSAKAVRTKNNEKNAKSTQVPKQNPAAMQNGATKKSSATPSVVSNPSSLAQQRMPKPKPEASKAQNGDAKGRPPRRPKKKDGKTANANVQSASKMLSAVDISGPTPAEMAALTKAKT